MVRFKPTYPKCSLSSLIGLAIRCRIVENYVLQPGWKLIVSLQDDSHEHALDLNKQLSDKERICAALENPELLRIISNCIRDPD